MHVWLKKWLFHFNLICWFIHDIWNIEVGEAACFHMENVSEQGKQMYIVVTLNRHNMYSDVVDIFPPPKKIQPDILGISGNFWDFI